MLSNKKPLSEPKLTKVYHTICCHLRSKELTIAISWGQTLPDDSIFYFWWCINYCDINVPFHSSRLNAWVIKLQFCWLVVFDGPHRWGDHIMMNGLYMSGYMVPYCIPVWRDVVEACHNIILWNVILHIALQWWQICQIWTNKTIAIGILCLIITIKLEVWTITHCFGLGHETMVCTVCLSIFLWSVYCINRKLAMPYSVIKEEYFSVTITTLVYVTRSDGIFAWHPCISHYDTCGYNSS